MMQELAVMFAGIVCTFGLAILIWVMAMLIVDGVLIPLDKLLDERDEEENDGTVWK